MTNLFKEGFYMKSKTGIEIKLPINAKVTIIAGHSATGKTKMINYISGLLRTHDIVECNYDRKKIKVIRDMSDWDLLINSKPVTDNIIFIDKFDLTNFEESIPFIEASENYFVLCAHRSIPQCGWSTDSIMEMKHDGKKYTLTPLEY